MADSEEIENTTDSSETLITSLNMQTRTLRLLTGRTQIFADVDVITEENIVSVLTKAMTVHERNAFDEDYLYQYYLGDQPIKYKTKTYRQDVNNIIVENRAQEIVTFKTAYALGEPVQYVLRSGITNGLDALNMVNDWMFSRKKSAEDKRLANWMHICGLGVRMVIPEDQDFSMAPFHIYTLDPRNSFVIYRNDIGHTPLLGVHYVMRKINGLEKRIYYCYTENEFYEIEGLLPAGNITKHETTILNQIPIIEYPLNMGREGVFEPVLPILDALNTIASNRVDNIQTFVDSLMLFHNVSVTREVILKMQELGALEYGDIDADRPADIKYLVSELNQQQTQTLKDDLWQAVKEIVGMPSQSDGSTSTSSNNGAEIVRNGWEQAESCAKDFELEFDSSEIDMLRLALRIGSTMAPKYTDLKSDVLEALADLRVGDIRIQFTRRNYENIATKSAVLMQMLNSDKVHPKLAFEHSGMFADPERAYTESMEYYQSLQKQNAQNPNGGANGSGNGSDDPNAPA